MEKKMENEMETTVMGLYRVWGLGYFLEPKKTIPSNEYLQFTGLTGTD